MTPEQQLARDIYMAEMWGYCREVSYGDRARKRRADQLDQRVMEERALTDGQEAVEGAA